MNEQRDHSNNKTDQQDHDEGMGATDWTMGQGDTSTDNTDWQQGGSADNDGGTSGDYVATEDEQ